MFNSVKEYFSFTSRDIRAVYVLLAVLIILLVVRYSLQFWFVSEPQITRSLDENLLIMEKARQAMAANERIKEPGNEASLIGEQSVPVQKSLTPFPFDPNSMSEADWQRMGFSARKALAIMNYTRKGGKFRSREDVRKLFVITPDEYAIIEPFIRLPVTESQKKISTDPSIPAIKETSNEPVRIDINRADTAALIDIRGIGPVLAKRIIKYRDQLGGIYSHEQLSEVFGIDSTRFEALVGAFAFSGAPLRKMNVNKLTVEELSRHPYIDFYLAKSIVDQRIRRGKYKSIDELQGVSLMHEIRFIKLHPYLVLD